MNTVSAVTDTARTALALGLNWLYHTQQPSDAIMHHLGISNPVDIGREERYFSFVPTGGPHNSDQPVVVVTATRPYRGEPGTGITHPFGGDEEMDMWQKVIEDLGYTVTGRWNGKEVSGSFCLAGSAHPSLLAAVQLYRAGCPDHPAMKVFCDCGWYAAGTARLVVPDWTVTGPNGYIRVDLAQVRKNAAAPAVDLMMQEIDYLRAVVAAAHALARSGRPLQDPRAVAAAPGYGPACISTAAGGWDFECPLCTTAEVTSE